MNWADSSDEEDNFVMTQVITEHAGLNDGTIGTNKVAVAGFSSDEEAPIGQEQSDTDSSESDDDDSYQNQPVKSELIEPKPKPVKARALSKKEKEALKAKEMDDLDNLLNEFGIEPTQEPNKTPIEETSTHVPPDDSEETLNKSSRKRRKSKKKKNVNSEQQDTQPSEIKTDVATILRSKSIKKEKSPAEIAAATAAKEAKAKKQKAEAANKKKKKKKKDKFAYGAPSR